MAINYTNPARGNTHELINRPIINNSGANQYATFLDLIKFGTLTDFINSGTTIDNWPDFFNTISAVLTSLDSSLRALETAIDNPRMCTIHWDENKGSSHVIQSDTLVVGQTFLEQEENFEDFPSVNGGGGYDTYGLFKGWYTAKTGGVSVDWDTIVPNTRETTFYGRWDTNKYTIHFENTGNSTVNDKTPIYKDYSYYTLPYATNYSDSTYNYTFRGWSLTNNGSVSFNINARFVLTDSYIEYTVRNVLTLYGVWESAVIQNTKTITFVDLWGTEHIEVFATGDNIDFTQYEIYYDYPLTYTITWRQDNYTIDNNAATVRINYPFEGWYTAATGGTKMTSKNTPYEQLVDGAKYYARASSTPIGYTRRLIPGVYQYEYVIQSDDIYIQFPTNNPTKVSTSQYTYEFDGWYTAPDGQGGYKIPTTGTSRPRLDSITNNTTYYAHFTQHEIQQTKHIYFYTAEGGSHVVDINEGESLNFGTVASENGWDTTKDYTVTWQHSPSNYGTYVNLTSGTFTRNVRYAQNYNYPWSINGNNIPRWTTTSYDDLEDGATYNMMFDSPIDPDNNNSTTLVIPTTQSSPTGMSFDYWQIVGGSRIYGNYSLSGINSNITIRAEYKDNYYTITFTDHTWDSSIDGFNYIIRKQPTGAEQDYGWSIENGQQFGAFLEAREGYVIPTDISGITITGDYRNASYTAYGQSENVYSLTITGITSDIRIKMNVQAYVPEVTYYWYVGQTNPSTMSSISPIVSDNSSPGWRLIGTTLPTYSASNKLWNANDVITTGTNLAKQYIAIPADSTACPRDGAGNDASLVDIYIQLANTTIDGVEYKVYETEGKMRRHNLDIF